MFRFNLIVALLATAGCSGSETAENRADSLTQRQRDSLVGTLPVPGAAAGVRGSLRATDSADARRAREARIAADSE